MNKVKKFGLWAVMGLASFAFVSAGSMKLLGVPMLHESFAAMGLPLWFGYFIGAAELAGGIGIWFKRVSAWAGAGLAVIMVGASYFHIAYAVPSAVPAIVLGVFSVIIVIARRQDAVLIGSQPVAA